MAGEGTGLSVATPSKCEAGAEPGELARALQRGQDLPTALRAGIHTGLCPQYPASTHLHPQGLLLHLATPPNTHTHTPLASPGESRLLAGAASQVLHQ